MRRLRYNAAVSLDGYIARPDGTFDWIIHDPLFDFGALFAQFDTLLMGRKTYEVLRAESPGGPTDRMKKYVISRVLKQEDAPGVVIVHHDVIATVSTLKLEPGKDIWLYGGGVLFRHLLDAHLVDTVELAVMPVLLSDGIPFLSPGRSSPVMKLEHQEVFPSGIVMLRYAL